MRHFSKFKSLTQEFKSNISGSVVPTFALGLTAIMLSAGIAIDYSRIAHAKSVMANSMDAALLSAAKDFSKGEKSVGKLKKSFEDFFLANVEGRAVTVSDFDIVQFSVDQVTGKVDAKVTADFDTSFMAIGGFDKVEIPVSSSAAFSVTPVEVSFVLDVTGSMGWDVAGGLPGQKRITALKGAAKNAVTKLLDGSVSNRMTIGLVPYSASVNVGNRTVLAGNQASPNGCVVGRLQKEFSAENFVNYPVNPAPAIANCPSAEIMPLTSNKNNLIKRIDSLVPSGATAGHLGIVWGQYLLSENVGLWGTSVAPRPAGAGANKIAILMTDGEFNTYWADGTLQNGVGANKSKASSRKMYEEMKDKGITIYSVVFGTDDANDPLYDCASVDKNGSKRFYKAKTAADLDKAFDAIASQILSLRLSS